jgi:hypothetical protein
MVVTSRHQLTPTATGAPARAGVRGCLPPMDAEPSSSRGQDPAVCRAGRPPRGGSSASAVNVMWRGGAVRCGAPRCPVTGGTRLSLLRPPDLDRTGATRPGAGCARGRDDGDRTGTRSSNGPRVNGGSTLHIRNHCASASPVQGDGTVAGILPKLGEPVGSLSRLGKATRFRVFL